MRYTLDLVRPVLEFLYQVCSRLSTMTFISFLPLSSCLEGLSTGPVSKWVTITIDLSVTDLLTVQRVHFVRPQNSTTRRFLCSL